MSTVWTNYRRGGSEKLVLLALADWANDEGGSLHPSIRAIAEKSCVSECQARRIVHGFIDAGFLEVVGNVGGGAPGATRQYRLHVDRLTVTASTHATPRIHATPRTDARDGSHGCAETASAHATQTTSRTTKNHQRGEERADAAPVARLVELYHQALPGHPRVQVLSEKRRAALRSRWADWKRHGGYASGDDGVAWWGRFFRFVGESEFLTGRVPPGPGRSEPFMADFDWITGRENMVKIFEGKYHRLEAAA